MVAMVCRYQRSLADIETNGTALAIAIKETIHFVSPLGDADTSTFRYLALIDIRALEKHQIRGQSHYWLPDVK